MKNKYILTAFEKDSNSPLAELFLQVRDFVKICIGNGVKEKYRENITSYFSKYGGFCYIKAYDEYIHIGWFRGVHIEDKYNLLFGTTKTTRGQKVYKLDKFTREAIKYYMDETFVFLLEHQELLKMKKRMKKYDSEL
jgi:hypothetical protein